jgi:hypothetical protein
MFHVKHPASGSQVHPDGESLALETIWLTQKMESPISTQEKRGGTGPSQEQLVSCSSPPSGRGMFHVEQGKMLNDFPSGPLCPPAGYFPSGSREHPFSIEQTPEFASNPSDWGRKRHYGKRDVSRGTSPHHPAVTRSRQYWWKQLWEKWTTRLPVENRKEWALSWHANSARVTIFG